ncbi:TIGR03087 family PEP-CTERM/XrtA system glycosyltransferase [Aurantiacibacter poecillastricola]|uniref:TIGR03087 family PEP-CTERM/XrtA system glycosyltransferase n=1 Tax=Aurantiacibacter poecillastricola TaxID=3064385 RepID=UPI00273FF167|nr:TIGR03087 family PEP-CTERM/XrtA system glycosyltransferase [Aurantiacibacter sp. 219JJ12-13]MDP5262158.1 TIGR03087 family PEP-CTERM/XrtA system glycosyltransferase [Aurantiacibacter sp. 219JJ12-13]
MGGEILFLAHRLPFPPDRGDRIRSYNILQALSKIAPVHVGCLADTRADAGYEPILADIAGSWCVAPRSKPLALAGVQALLERQPVSLAAFRAPRLARWVETTLRERDIGAVYVFSGQMGQYVPGGYRGRLVVDLVDVDSAKFEAYGQRASGPRAWIHAREGKLLGRVEASLVERADTTLLVSEPEADLLRRRVGSEHEIRALRNGIDHVRFDPSIVTPEPALSRKGPHYVFTGQMDYAPNVEAVCRMASRIMPEVLRALPDARFHVVGRAPAREVMALDGINGTHVVGEVPDTRPWLAGADAVVAPLTIARGVQNKVLEAMAMARPVVLSPDAAVGIDAGPAEFVIAHDDAAFAESLVGLSHDPETGVALGTAARHFVQERMGWSALLADLPLLLGFKSGSLQNAA